MVSIEQATLAPKVKFAKGPIVYKARKPVDKRLDTVDEGGEQTTAEALAGVPQEYAVHRIVCHGHEEVLVRNIVCCYGNTPAGHMVEPP